MRKGLTLVEIGVVTMILGLLIALSISSLTSMIRPSVAGTVERFQQALFFCWQSAILHNEVVIMKVDIEKRTYSAYRVIRGPEGIIEKKIIESSFPSNSYIRDAVDLRGIKTDTGIIQIPYTYTGIGEDYSIHFGDDSGTKKTLLVYRYNGKSLIKNGEVTRKSKGGDEKEKDDTDPLL